MNKMIILLLIIISISFLIFFMTYFFDKKMNFNSNKSNAFECGFDPFSSSRLPFSLRFFKLCIIFVVFDIEIIVILPSPYFIFPNSLFFFIFLGILLIIFFSLIFEWYQNSLNWMK